MKWGATIKDKRITMSEYNSHAFHDWAVKNEGCRVSIEPVLPESRKLRGYFEGCLVGLVCFYSENYDYRSWKDREIVREWLKVEFNGEYAVLKGKTLRIAKSTTSGALKGMVEKVYDWLVENYDPPKEALDPEAYKKFRDELYSFGEWETYIDYLLSLNILRK